MSDELFDFCPWLFWRQATEDERELQLAWQDRLRGRGVERIGERSFLSPLAAIYDARLSIGADSYMAAHVYLTGDVTMGDFTTLNPYAVVRGTACDVLDVIHPLWLCGQQTPHRRDEVRAWARERLDAALPLWRTGAGFAFDPAPGAGGGREPSLQGTEMWLSIVWLLADVLGESGALGYRPRGVHRPEPGWRPAGSSV
jgi:hypothetical protein